MVQGGQVKVYSAEDPHGVSDFTLRMPACDSSGTAVVQLGGQHIATISGDTVALWAHGELTAATAFGEYVASAEFVPQHAELAVIAGQRLYVWSYDVKELRAVELPAAGSLAVSPSGDRLALALADGSFRLVDLAAIRELPPGEPIDATATIPARCPGGSGSDGSGDGSGSDGSGSSGSATP